MANSLVMHIDKAPWVAYAGTPESQEPKDISQQLIGDIESGPWIYVVSCEPGYVAGTHSHDLDEVIYIVEGEMTMGEWACGPGTVIFLERNTEYGFTVGKERLRFLNIRHGRARFKPRDREWINE